MSSVDKVKSNDKDVANITVGLIGDDVSGKSSLNTTLTNPEHVKFQYSMDTNKYIGTRFGRNNVLFIDIECTRKQPLAAINVLFDCDVIIYAIPWTGYDDEKSERLMRRYLEIAHIFRVKHFIVAITKIDYNSAPFITEKIFERATNRVKDIMNKTNIEEYDIMPVAEETLESVKWYDGPTLKDKLSDINTSREYKEDPFLLTVTHFCKDSAVIIGKVRRGMVSVGQRIKVFPSGMKGQIESIQIHCKSAERAHCGDRVRIRITLKMTNEMTLNIKRGDIMRIDEHPNDREPVEPVVFRFSATIYVQIDRLQSIPRLTIESEANISGTDEQKSEYVGIVTCGNIPVGTWVESIQTRKRGIIRWIKRITSASEDEEVKEAKCGDRIRFQVMSKQRKEWREFETQGQYHYSYSYVPLQLKQGEDLKTLFLPKTADFRKMYPKTNDTKNHLKFNVFIGNSRAKCHIHSIKWKKNVDGKRIENPEYLEEGDTAKVIIELLKPIHVTPYNEYPEFGAFVMVRDHWTKLTESFVIGKVDEITETTTLKTVHPKMKTHNSNSYNYSFSFCRKNQEMLSKTLWFLNSFSAQANARESASSSCECKERLTEMMADTKLMSVSKMKPTYSISGNWSERNLCVAHYRSANCVALTCGSGLNRLVRRHRIALLISNQMSRMLKKLIPIEVVQIIEVYSNRIRRALRNVHCRGSWRGWKPIDELAGRDISKMVCWPCGWSVHSSNQLYLEDNGTLWRETSETAENADVTLQIMEYFSMNSIKIKDIAIRTGAINRRLHVYKHSHATFRSDYWQYYCLAVDENDNVYSWGNSKSGNRSCNEFGQCGVGQKVTVDTPTLITFPFDPDETVERCIAIKCAHKHSYVGFKVKKHDEMGREYVVDKHFMFGYNEENQCLTFDGRQEVRTPFCINETVRDHYGGEIDDIFVEHLEQPDGRRRVNKSMTYVVVKNCYRFA